MASSPGLGSETALRLYIDGVLAAESGSGGGNYGSSTHPFNAGGGGVFDAFGNAFAGQIDEVSVWTRALADEEIDGLFQGTVRGGFRALPQDGLAKSTAPRQQHGLSPFPIRPG
jgi:hypothetical protein